MLTLTAAGQEDHAFPDIAARCGVTLRWRARGAPLHDPLHWVAAADHSRMQFGPVSPFGAHDAVSEGTSKAIVVIEPRMVERVIGSGLENQRAEAPHSSR